MDEILTITINETGIKGNGTVIISCPRLKRNIPRIVNRLIEAGLKYGSVGVSVTFSNDLCGTDGTDFQLANYSAFRHTAKQFAETLIMDEWT